jgi:hypothetical protein
MNAKFLAMNSQKMTPNTLPSLENQHSTTKTETDSCTKTESNEDFTKNESLIVSSLDESIKKQENFWEGVKKYIPLEVREMNSRQNETKIMTESGNRKRVLIEREHISQDRAKLTMDDSDYQIQAKKYGSLSYEDKIKDILSMKMDEAYKDVVFLVKWKHRKG